jgi:hypothetical protein
VQVIAHTNIYWRKIFAMFAQEKSLIGRFKEQIKKVCRGLISFFPV